MKGKINKFVEKQTSILAYEQDNSFIFYNQKTWFQIILFSVISYVLIWIYEFIFTVQGLETIYFAILLLGSFVILYTYQNIQNVSKEEKQWIIIRKILNYVFIFSSVMYLLTDIYNQLNSVIVILNTLLLSISLIIQIIQMYIIKSVRSTLTLLGVILCIFLIIATSVNVIHTERLMIEFLIVLGILLVSLSIAITIYYLNLFKLTLITSVVLFILASPVFFGPNTNTEELLQSNYFKYESTSFPRDMKQIIEYDNYTYILTEADVYIYQDDEQVFHKTLTQASKLLYIMNDSVHLFTSNILRESNEISGTVELYSFDGQTINTVFIGDTSLWHEEPPIIIDQQYIYNYNRTYMYIIDLETGVETEYLPEDNTFIVDQEYLKAQIYNESIYTIFQLTENGQFIQYSYADTLNPKIYNDELENDILQDLSPMYIYAYNEQYDFIRGYNTNYLYDRSSNTVTESIGYIREEDQTYFQYYIVDIISTNHFDLYYTANKQFVWVTNQEVIHEENGIDSQINLSNTNDFYIENKLAVPNQNQDIIYYPRVPNQFQSELMFISSITAFMFIFKFVLDKKSN